MRTRLLATTDAGSVDAGSVDGVIDVYDDFGIIVFRCYLFDSLITMQKTKVPEVMLQVSNMIHAMKRNWGHEVDPKMQLGAKNARVSIFEGCWRKTCWSLAISSFYGFKSWLQSHWFNFGRSYNPELHVPLQRFLLDGGLKTKHANIRSDKFMICLLIFWSKTRTLYVTYQTKTKHPK